MIVFYLEQHVDARWDYMLDFEALGFLLDGETLVDADWEMDEDNELTLEPFGTTETTTSVWVSGGEVSVIPAKAYCHVTLSSGAEETVTLEFSIREG